MVLLLQAAGAGAGNPEDQENEEGSHEVPDVEGVVHREHGDVQG